MKRILRQKSNEGSSTLLKESTATHVRPCVTAEITSLATCATAQVIITIHVEINAKDGNLHSSDVQTIELEQELSKDLITSTIWLITF